MRLSKAAPLVAFAALAFPAGASAHYIPESNLSCNQLDFSYADFSPNSSETLTWTANGVQFAKQNRALNGTAGTFSETPPDLSSYQGDTITVNGVRTGFSDGTFSASLTTAYCSSPEGPAGPQGPAGPAGKNGTNGAPGANGKNGTNGTNGATGVEGPAGKSGSNGANGSNGKPGKNGKKSCGCKRKHHKRHKKPMVCKLPGGAVHKCGAPLPPPIGNG